MSGLNIGDIIFQLVALGVPVGFIVIFLRVIRISKQKQEQLYRIEEQLNSLQKSIQEKK
ncbi:hypothetical protein [Bacillus coahuilensis]|uniref:hypothetical protein n=1 Tax=Bacillus coahuilensis TaxID=408580 RepID=UPI0001850A75|nr:hypothetical protein [Bacillus coahuilensis]